MSALYVNGRSSYFTLVEFKSFCRGFCMLTNLIWVNSCTLTVCGVKMDYVLSRVLSRVTRLLIIKPCSCYSNSLTVRSRLMLSWSTQLVMMWLDPLFPNTRESWYGNTATRIGSLGYDSSISWLVWRKIAGGTGFMRSQFMSFLQLHQLETWHLSCARKFNPWCPVAGFSLLR